MKGDERKPIFNFRWFYVIALILIIVVVAVFFLSKAIKNHNNGDSADSITRAQAARMLTLFEHDSLYDPDEDDILLWYEKYMHYIDDQGYIAWDESDIKGDKAFDSISYGEIKSYLSAKGYDFTDIFNKTGIDLEKKKRNRKITKTEFYSVYEYMVSKGGNGCVVQRKNLSVVGTPSSMTYDDQKRIGAWRAVTTDGIYDFEGLSLDLYTDRVVCAYVSGNAIVSVITEVDEPVIYNNVWISFGHMNSLSAYVEGIDRSFVIPLMDDELKGVVADITINDGSITGIVVKKDSVSGKVLKVTNGFVELEGYGELEFEDKFRVYKNYGVFEELSKADILVGYNVSDFIVADGKVCACVVNSEVMADKVRVLIMSTGYTSRFHERITLVSENGFRIRTNDECFDFAGGELVDIYPDSKYMEDGRIFCEPYDENDSITVLSIERGYGNPYYYGTFEIAKEEGSLVLINELPLEEYLCHVVPSEMYVKYGVEALKVQAVCARSYAYTHILENSFRMYGAHMDDSVSFQVYNNIEAQDDSTQAVRETYGQVLSKNGNVVCGYYFSTSCGHSSDLSLWSMDPNFVDRENIYISKELNKTQMNTDLSDEKDFTRFILGENEKDYDYGFPYYRWNFYVSIDELSNVINDKLGNGEKIGQISDMVVINRSSGGAIKKIVIMGSEGEKEISGEVNVRTILGSRNYDINTYTGETVNFDILPSSYVTFEKVKDGSELVGFNFYGGGYGHGIGMSQNAVSVMVKNGMDYKEILAYFYNGTEITSIVK